MFAKSFPRKQFPTKIFIKNILEETFYGCKIISSKTKSYQNCGCNINFSKKGLPKVFMQHIFDQNFHGCKIVSLKTGSYQKFSSKNLGRKFFMVAKAILRKPVPTKNVHVKFFGQNFFMFAKLFPREQVPTKKFQQKNLDENFFMFTKSFPRIQFPNKIFIKIV
jgi:hypothetical protein